MHQAIAAREDVHKRPEGSDVHHFAAIDLADFSGRRVQDQADLALCLADAISIGGGDGDNAGILGVVHVDLGPSLGLYGVDDLPLGADDLADLVQRDLKLDDLGGRGTNVVTGGGNGPGHDLQDL